MFQYFRRNLFHLYSFQNPSLKSISQLSYSTNQPSFKVSYLINSCGLSQEAALKVAKKVDFETAEKPDSVLNFFKNYDLTKTQISKIIAKFPKFLVSNPDKTLKPKFEFFLGLGMPAPELAMTLCVNPYMLRNSLQNQIIPAFNFLKSILHTNKDILVALRHSRYFTQFSTQTVMEPNITTLRNHGVPESRILKLIMTNAGALGLKSDHFSEVVMEVKEMGFDPASSLFVVAVIALSVMSKPTWERKSEVFRSFGWSDDEILSAFKKQPWYMITSEKKVKKVMDFFVHKMDRNPSFLSRHPNLLLLSLEKRIRPRCMVLQVLVSKDILEKDFNLSTILILSEKEFMVNYVTKNEERVPEILSAYQGKTAGIRLDIGSKASDVIRKL
ncbi:uncharacterized protein LOC143887414 [Tasmannia lanceolata]|uniref:uncharacterized protein LOC143887414 n=1 Tax=Tasmannia lanceolata TaxID=3420 RepID=UPI00406488E8